MDDLIKSYEGLGYKNFEKVETATGTGYYAENSRGGAIYLPPDAASADAIVGMYPGMGDNWYHPQTGIQCYRNYINDTIKTGNAPTGTIIVFSDSYDQYTDGILLDVVSVAIDDNHLNITNAGVIDYSGSGNSGMFAGGMVANKYPELDVRIVNNDAWRHNYVQSCMDTAKGVIRVEDNLKGKKSMATLANMSGNTMIISFNPEEGKISSTRYAETRFDTDWMAQNGHYSFEVTSDSNNHQLYNQMMLESDAVGFVAGKCDLKTDYFTSMRMYDKEAAKWVDVDINEIAKKSYVDKFLETKYDFDLKKLEKYLGKKDENSQIFIDYYNAISGLEGIMNYISNNTDTSTFKLSSLEGNNIINGMFSYSEPFLSTTHLLDYRIKQGLLSCAVQVNDLAQTDLTLAALAQILGEDGMNGIIGKRIIDKFAPVLEGSVDSTSRVASYIGTIEPGSLGIFDSTQIDLLMNSKMMSDLQHQMKVSGSIYDQLVELKNSGSYGGDAFNEFNKLVDSYCTCAHKRLESAAKLYYVYKSCLKRMQNFMDTKEITRVDDTHYQEFKDEIARNEATIQELTKKAQQKETRTIYKQMKILGSVVYVPAGTEEYYPYKAECEAQIADLETLNRVMQETVNTIEEWNALVNECNKEIYEAECDVNVNFNQIVLTFPEIKPVFLEDTFA